MNGINVWLKTYTKMRLRNIYTHYYGILNLLGIIQYPTQALWIYRLYIGKDSFSEVHTMLAREKAACPLVRTPVISSQGLWMGVFNL